MFKVAWDRETGGVKLSSLVGKDTVSIPPRPVFFEGLNLLGLKTLGWNYPECEEPLPKRNTTISKMETVANYLF